MADETLLNGASYVAAVQLRNDVGRLLTQAQAAQTAAATSLDAATDLTGAVSSAKTAVSAAQAATVSAQQDAARSKQTADAAAAAASISEARAAASAANAAESAAAAGKLTTSVAAVPISAFTVIKGDAACTPCDAAVLEDSDTVLGLALASSAVGAPVQYRRSGVITDPSFAFTPGRPVFCGPGGLLTQTVPARPPCAFLMRVGVATSTTSITLALQPPVILA